MKKAILVLSVLFFSLLFSSCKKEEESSTPDYTIVKNMIIKKPNVWAQYVNASQGNAGSRSEEDMLKLALKQCYPGGEWETMARYAKNGWDLNGIKRIYTFKDIEIEPIYGIEEGRIRLHGYFKADISSSPYDKEGEFYADVYFVGDKSQLDEEKYWLLYSTTIGY